MTCSRPFQKVPRRPATLSGHPAVHIVLGLILAWAAVAAAEVRPLPGYQPRACGFDLDDDGIFGEPEDCRVCNGVDADPDGDGIDEDLVYLDCDRGSDTPDCGSPWAPCRSLGWVWGTIVDGPDDGAEDIVCFRGVCRDVEELQPPAGGVPGTYVVPASGSEVRDWLRPRDPTMLIGWDDDGDGAYPPVDTDDIAVLDGAGLGRAFRLDAHTDHLEMAHFTVRDYGRGGDIFDSGFVRFGPSYDLLQFQVFHDLELVGINRDRATTSGNALVNLFPTNTVPQWILFENLSVIDNGQWFARGAGFDEAPDMGPFRFTRISRTAHSCDYETCGSSAGSTVFKLWGYLSGVEILDSVWDANVRAWQPKPRGGPSGSSFAIAGQCTQDWTIRNNRVLDYKNPFVVKGYTKYYCNYPDARPVDGIVIDANYVWNTYEPWFRGDHGVRIEGAGERVGEQVGRVEITNNVLASTTGWEAALWIWAGNQEAPSTGEILVAHNTLYGNINRHAVIAVGNFEGSDPIFGPAVRVFENLVVGLEAYQGTRDLVIATTHAADLVSDGNVFDPAGDFSWVNAAPIDLGSWSQDLGFDTGSVACVPSFVDPAAGDFHLDPSDTCASSAVSTAVDAALDIDGEARSQAAHHREAGADERLESGPP